MVIDQWPLVDGEKKKCCAHSKREDAQIKQFQNISSLLRTDIPLLGRQFCHPECHCAARGPHTIGGWGSTLTYNTYDPCLLLLVYSIAYVLQDRPRHPSNKSVGPESEELLKALQDALKRISEAVGDSSDED